MGRLYLIYLKIKKLKDTFDDRPIPPIPSKSDPTPPGQLALRGLLRTRFYAVGGALLFRHE